MSNLETLGSLLPLGDMRFMEAGGFGNAESL
jgi:hypothetical protein